MKTLALTKHNFKRTKLAILIAALVLVVQAGADIINTAILRTNIGQQASLGLYINGQVFQISAGWFVLLFVTLLAILVPARLFTKYMHLNVKKSTFIGGCAATYVAAALVASGVNLLLYNTLDVWLKGNGYVDVWNMVDVFGWMNNGPLVAFLQGAAFMLCVAAFFHMLTLAQNHWYGWAMDFAILIILCVFLPIEPLRNAVVWFFNMIIFNSSPLVQIGSCVAVGAVFYGISIIPVQQKRI